ncbi:DNA-binding response regulator, NarL/FixJ family, contains REC and HTH domains [Saccharopolyspora antimicrobica]|uniref:DNA-binding response regulator, NarL/FixJ family, contains REC and HTH domains n=1 Tax=Saccharopolyspora antimicrobica TaxID=455193 RepID=A0A1I5LY29_9PSEU|nr:response regulator transcription factor [Saccharopolyspora antimicrobica]RKT89063.1 LuxR family two component transcriptional regulator [Saccharopolyspora antimicrobica]SFP02294.1 DNA-binding response regulator, NarL/FixJ family, contains REC and HTH domains [Saccharopolyspora antimicrobica]
MIRVVVADDEAMVRTGIRGILETDPGIEVVAEAANGHEAIDLVARHRPDVAALDIRMPGLDGLGAAEAICRSTKDTAVLMLTTFSEDSYIARALGAGASGFLLKSGDPRELIAGVRAVSEGAAYLSPKVAARVISNFGGDRMLRAERARAAVAGLSDRERQVLALLGAGRSNQEIARELFLVEGTIKSYVSTILNRLGVRNRVRAAIIAHEADLIDD